MNKILLFFRALLFNIFFFYMLFHISFFYRFQKDKNLRKKVIYWVEIINWGLKNFVGIDYKIEGNMLDTPAIYASRHESTWETVLFFIIFSANPIVLKKELTTIPLFGGFLKKMQMLPVDRQHGAESIKSLIRQSKITFSKNENLVIFPEGTRKKTGEFSDINISGIYALYKTNNVPVVPITLNSGIFWPRRSFLKYKGTVTVKFLEPILPGLDKNKFSEVFNNAIKNNIINVS